jgi:uncharacterized NAD(P)/FAD-binding protein YdhS
MINKGFQAFYPGSLRKTNTVFALYSPVSSPVLQQAYGIAFAERSPANSINLPKTSASGAFQADLQQFRVLCTFSKYLNKFLFGIPIGVKTQSL